MAAELPHARRARLGAYGAAQSQTLLGIALACRLLTRICHRPVRAWQLRFPYGGKPYGAALPDFSISHSGQWVACAAASAGRVGLDLEVPDNAPLPTFAHCFDAQELEQASDARAALGIWCSKEATVKAAGATLAELRAVTVRGAEARFGGERWCVREPAAPAGIICRLVTDREPLALACEQVSWRALWPLQSCRAAMLLGKYRAGSCAAAIGQSA